MAASYLRRGMDGPATFSLYVRDMPKERGFLVAAGLEDCLRALETFSFEEDDLVYLSRIGFDRRAIHDFAELGSPARSGRSPRSDRARRRSRWSRSRRRSPEAQLVETILLNQVTLHTTLASKAARYVVAAEGRGLVDFAFRRAHGGRGGPGGREEQRHRRLPGDVQRRGGPELGLRTTGTMAHSFITAFDDEREAFRAFAEDHPHRTTLLVDTYDTLNGVRTAIDVIGEMDRRGRSGSASTPGDLDRLSRESRRLLDHAGLRQAKIFASGGLDEHEVAELVRAGAPVDAFGIGTQLGVSADAPYIDAVYKLVEYDGRPVLKLSPAKATAPGRKQVWRGPSVDVIGLRDEAAPGPNHEPLLEPVMRAGRRLARRPTIEEMRRGSNATSPRCRRRRPPLAPRARGRAPVRGARGAHDRDGGGGPAPGPGERLGGRQPGRPRRLVGGDRVGVPQGEVDVVVALEEAPPAEVVEREGLLHRRGRHRERLEVDPDPRRRVVEDRVHQGSDGLPGQLDRQEPDLAAVVAEDVGEARRDHGPEPVVLERPGRVLAAGAAAEVRAREEDRGARVALVVQDERGVLPPLVEEERPNPVRSIRFRNRAGTI